MRTNTKKIVIWALAALMLALIPLAVLAGHFSVAGSAADEEAEQAWFYLSDFDPDSGTTGWDGSNLIAVNGGIEPEGDVSGLWLSEGDASGAEYENNRWAFAKQFTHGISVQAEGTIVYDISEMNATRFTCYYGANTKHASGKGTVGLIIYTLDAEGEQTTLYSLNSSEDAQRLGVKGFPVGQYDPYVTVDVEIPADAVKLCLNPTDGENGNDSDHAVFADPKLYADFVNLSDLEGYDVSTGWDTVRYDQTPDGALTLKTAYKANHNNDNWFARDVAYERGLFLHAESSITFNIEGMGIKRFTSFYGLSELQPDYTPTAVFKVYFDDELAFTGEKTRGEVNVGIDSNIDLVVPEGTKEITLTTEPKDESSKDGCHTLWVCPRLFGTGLNAIREIRLDLNKDLLTEGDTAELQAYSVNYKNEITDIAAEDITINTSAPDVLTAEGSRLVAKGAGTATLTLKYGDFEQKIEMTVYGEENSWKVSSPDSSSVIKVALDDGVLYYSAERDGSAYVLRSEMGLMTSIGNFTDGLSLVSASEQREIDETYDPVTGKYSEYRNHCFEQTLTFARDGAGAQLQVILRAYDDGVAFRYAIAYDGDFTISDENSGLSLPSYTYAYYQPNTTGKYPNTHEQQFVSGMLAKYDVDLTLPFMYTTVSGIDVVVSEAVLDGTYCGSVLQSLTNTQLKFGFPEQQLNASYSGSTVLNVSGNFASPWRAFIAGDEETLFSSTMIENLSDPCVLDDTSWIEPGVTAWSWMSGVNSGSNPYDYQASKQVMMEQIDFAAEMGWQYYILDEGWMKRISNEEAQSQGLTGGRDWLPNGGWYIGFYDFMPEVIEYANSKNIGLIGWVHVSQLNDPTDDYKQMDNLFKALSDMGIKGIKADFFNSENQLTIELYNKIYEKLAKYQLLGNMHGANKPTGERRTYPNILNREAIYGEELNSTRLSQMVIQAYVRGVVGPTDLTPYIYPADKSDTTMGSQMALSVIFESGMTCFASTADEFRALDENIRQYYYAYPTDWKNSLLLDGEVGASMTAARQAEDGRWYIGGISVSGGDQTVSLDFLEEGVSYTAYIYTDGGDRFSVNFEEKSVVKGDDLSVRLSDNGGFAVKIVKSDAQLSVENDDEKGTVTITSGGEALGDTLPAAGSFLDVEVSCKTGYRVAYLVWNGRKVNADADGKVSLMVTGGDLALEVVYESVSAISVETTAGGSVSLRYEDDYIGLNESVVSGGTLWIRAYAGRGYELVSVTVNGKAVDFKNGYFSVEINEAEISLSFVFAEQD